MMNGHVTTPAPASGTRSTALEQLSEQERVRLAELEARVKDGIEGFLAVGAALCEIRNSRLYREGYPSFGAYCEGRWRMSGRRGYQLIQAATVWQELSENRGSHDE